MSVFLDVQGFKLERNKFLPKELALFDGIRICHYVFKPPFNLNYLPPDLVQQATWLMNNHHCIDWEIGFTPVHNFSEIMKTLTANVETVYVKGKEKTEYVRKYSSATVIELAEQPVIHPTEPSCFYHLHNPCICALSNVFFLHENFVMK